MSYKPAGALNASSKASFISSRLHRKPQTNPSNRDFQNIAHSDARWLQSELHKHPSTVPPALGIRAAILLLARSLSTFTSPIFICLLLLMNVSHASAETFLGPLERNCTFRKLYGVTLKLLAVYVSHVITIKLEPGTSNRDGAYVYATAALQPFSSSLNTLRDLTHRRSNIGLPQQSGGVFQQNVYLSMQKAINAGACCIRVSQNRVSSGTAVPRRGKVRAKPLDDGELFIRVPRGTPANMFDPMIIPGNSQLLKATVGAVQLVFATIQLISATNSHVSAYGYGSFVYTIIPYAFGSVLNIMGALLTMSYTDVTEVEFRSAKLNSPAHAPSVSDVSVTDGESYELLGRRSQGYRTLGDGDSVQGLPKTSITMNGEASPRFWSLCIVEIAAYLAIVGGITHFHPGISTRVERGFFVSWVVLGIVLGALISVGSISESPVTICDADDSETRLALKRSPKVQNDDEPYLGDNFRRACYMFTFGLMNACFGAATVGGVVMMVLKYMHLFQC